MRTIAVAAVTCALAIPASTGADIERDGPEIRPRRDTVEIDDAAITLDVDRGIQRIGGQVSATLVATSPRPHRVHLVLDVTRTMGFGPERTPRPDQLVARRDVVLDAEPGGGPPVVQTFRLERGTKLEGHLEWYTLSAHEPHLAEAASASVGTWTGDSFPIEIEPPAKWPDDGPFEVAVRVTNTTREELAPTIELGAHIAGLTDLIQRASLGSLDDYKIETSDPDAPALVVPPGATALRTFRITPARPGLTHFAFVAQAYAENGDSAMTVAAFDRTASVVLK
ncbi:MAG TPA: hypothetical protein VGF94_18250 [Kofleriaceae bacterium]